MGSTSASVRLVEGGRIVIPARFRKAIGAKEGDSLILELHDDGLKLTTRAAGLRRARQILAPFLTGPSLTDELLEERARADD